MNPKISIPLWLLVLTACVSPKKALMQSWKIDDVVFLDSLNTMTPEQKMILTRNLKNDIRFEFLADSVYRVTTSEETVKGKWWFSKDKKVLFTVNEQGTIESKIHELKKDKLRFESSSEHDQSFIFTCSPVTGSK